MKVKHFEIIDSQYPEISISILVNDFIKANKGSEIIDVDFKTTLIGDSVYYHVLLYYKINPYKCFYLTFINYIVNRFKSVFFRNI